MRNLTRSLIVVLLLSANATPSSFNGGEPSYRPEARHPVDIRFFVDERSYLSLNYLEITVREDRFRKRIVKVEPELDSTRAAGLLYTVVPDGDLTLVTCALVSCPERETELLCGEVNLPAQIPIDLIHEITYSTKLSCEAKNIPRSLVQRPHPSVDAH